MASPVLDRAQTSHRVIGLVFAATLLAPDTALTQPVDLPLPTSSSGPLPPGLSVAQIPNGAVYVDAAGRTLYGLDLRTLLRWGPDPALYCKDRCGDWMPLLAPAGAMVNIAYPKGFGDRLRDAIAGGTESSPAPATAAAIVPASFHADPLKAPDWTVIAGPAGPQWVYKGWHMVYVRKGDGRASTSYDGAENFSWNTLKYVPRAPSVNAPGGIKAVLIDGAYVLADSEGHTLFTGNCTAPCAAWKPLAGGMASAGSGVWQVSTKGDRPQWTYRGRPVFVSQEADPALVPPSAEVLRP